MSKILLDHIDYLPILKLEIDKLLGKFGVFISGIKLIFDWTDKSKILYYDEICYFAKQINTDPYKVLMIQMIYEMSSACTSAILSFNGEDFYFRTMDSRFDFLKNITIGLNLKRNREYIGKVITWVGYVGYLTAINTFNNYTLAINYRKPENVTLTSLFKNLYRTTSLETWPIGYLIREIIDNRMVLNSATDMIFKFKLADPCYITVLSPDDNKSFIITRDCDKLVDVRTTNLIQTNCDWISIENILDDKNKAFEFSNTPENILWSLERTILIKRIQDQIDKKIITTIDDITRSLLKFPVYNNETIYFCYQFQNSLKSYIVP